MKIHVYSPKTKKNLDLLTGLILIYSKSMVPSLALKTQYVPVLSHFSCLQLFATLWTPAHQAPLFMKFSKQEYLSGLPCPSPGDLPALGIKPVSLMPPALAGGFFTTSARIQQGAILKKLIECIMNDDIPGCHRLNDSTD